MSHTRIYIVPISANEFSTGFAHDMHSHRSPAGIGLFSAEKNTLDVIEK